MNWWLRSSIRTVVRTLSPKSCYPIRGSRVGFFTSQSDFTVSQRPYPNLFFTSSETVVNLAAILLVILPLIACKLISISTPRRTWTFNLRLLQYLTCRYWRRAMLYPVELSEHVSGQGRIWTYELRRGLIYSQHALTTCIPVQNFRWFVRVPTSQWATTFALQDYLLFFLGHAGFGPATPCAQGMCSTRLS